MDSPLNFTPYKMSGIQFTCVGGMFSKFLFFLGKNFFAGFIYIEHIVALVVKNYCKSLDKLEDGIIRVQLV